MNFTVNHLFFFSSALVLVLLLLLIWERVSVANALKHLPWRIHVNGTRGKSSVTEYICAVLQANTDHACGKITGILPTFIDASMRKILLKRRGPARIQEQFSTIRRAVKKNCDTLVLECMSIDPELQKVESRFFQPNVTVLTNIRDDHFESMGKDINEHADALISSISSGVEYIVASKSDFSEKIVARATEIGARWIKPSNFVKDDEIIKYPGVFTDNINLAICACECMGIQAEGAKKSILSYIDSQINNTIIICNTIDNKKIHFINSFAVNDIPSLITFFEKNINSELPVVALINTRRDRPLRSVQFAQWLCEQNIFKKFIIMGDHQSKMKQLLLPGPVSKESIITWNGNDIDQLFKIVTDGFEQEIQLIGMANIAGKALRLLEEIKKHGSNNI